MVAYSFKARFVEPIRLGTKRQTIRAPRKGNSRHARPGEAVQLYYGLRTRQCFRIGDAICCGLVGVFLGLSCDEVLLDGEAFRGVLALDHFAALDGFASWDEMKLFWDVEHPGLSEFEGSLVQWTDFRIGRQPG